jgi:hypothetical protein
MITLWLMTATWAASAPPAPQTVSYSSAVPTQALSQQPQGSSPYHAVSYPPPPPLAVKPVAATPVPAPVEAGQPGVVYVEVAPPIQPQDSAYAVMPSLPATVTAQRPSIDLPQHGRDRIGHEHDYSWITGYLYYVHANGGQWVLRYAELGQQDRYGGSVVLAPTVEMHHYREGDLVTVHGEVIREGRATSALGGAFYRVHVITMVERR